MGFSSAPTLMNPVTNAIVMTSQSLVPWQPNHLPTNVDVLLVQTYSMCSLVITEVSSANETRTVVSTQVTRWARGRLAAVSL